MYIDYKELASGRVTWRVMDGEGTTLVRNGSLVTGMESSQKLAGQAAKHALRTLNEEKREQHGA